MTNINKSLIEKILNLNEKFLKFAQNNIFAGSDLTPTQFNILGEIILNNGLSINLLKEKLIVSAPALSQLLNRMEASGLITRKISKTDKREITISPTKKAIEQYNKTNELYIKIADEKLGNIKDKDKEIMIKFLEYIEKSI